MIFGLDFYSQIFTIDNIINYIDAGVAQLARARPCQGRGCEFETHRPLQKKLQEI